LEQPDTTIEGTPISSEKEPPRPSLPHPHPIIEEMMQIDLFSMTPLDALNRLADLQRRIAPTGQDNHEK
jgi:DNA mismatch repair protein MutS